MNDKVTGVIFPLPINIAERILDKKKKIFIKYPTHNNTKKSKTKLKENIKLFIYISKFKGKIFGEAIINKIDYLSINNIPKIYLKNLMLNYHELQKYSKGRENKKAVLLHLKGIKKYVKPKKIKVPITMAGRYVLKGDGLNV